MWETYMSEIRSQIISLMFFHFAQICQMQFQPLQYVRHKSTNGTV